MEGDLFYFLVEYEDQVEDHLRYNVLDIALATTPTRCWATQKVAVTTWDDVCLWMEVRFGLDPQDIVTKYYFQGGLEVHVETCITIWNQNQVIEDEWSHKFIHMLGPIPKMWYI